ncbi:alpha/beta hydrolase family protein [Occultella kanbiaonis]|uniref:alpha/beta hydrolase family protein n=1 Tax=Occultella kanbiaonis TaxID=2675754 RepID=UPI0012B98ECC|nr:S9 family peptidase [Occultella kanbiaonis]
MTETDTRTRAPFGAWPSPLGVTELTSGTVRLAEVALDGEATYWIEGRPSEGGRQALVRHEAGGAVTDVVDATFDVRTRAHEYGGASYAVTPTGVVLSRREDDLLYRVDRGADGSFARPVPLVPADGRRYADLEVDSERGVVYAVAEDHGAPGGQRTDPRATLVSVPLDGSGVADPAAIAVLVDGPDFVTSPRLSADGALLAWISWDHPSMPWDSTTLHVASVADGGGRLLHERTLAGGPGVSAAEPQWTPTGDLIHVDDRTGWWNLYRTEFVEGEARTRHLHPAEADFSLPQWGFGPRTHDILDEAHLVVSWSSGGHRFLGAMLTANGQLERWDGDWEPWGPVRAHGDRVVFIGESPTQPGAIVELDLVGGHVNVLRSSSELHLDPADVSRPEAVRWRSEVGIAHGFLYPPTSARAAGPAGELPPLLVFSHGGPTGATSPGFRPSVQFWTTRGFAVLDVNYSGSTGYGRAYRDRLRGAWGIADVRDCAAGARWLADTGRVDGARLAIRGGSAGGFTTLAALTFTDTFTAGASLYGIGDLEALARDTHKFESRYLDSLIGPYPQKRDRYLARSPIHHTDRLSAPMILLQGTDDRVVPPNQAESMAKAVADKGLHVELVMFDGEGHGFRRAENIQAAASAELAFYGRAFGFTPA